MSGRTVIWLLFSVCLILSFLLSGMESGVFALSRLRIRQQMRAGRVSARVLHQFLEHSENFLWTILVGNTVANFFILGWIVVVLHDVFREQRLWFMAVFAAIVFLFYAVFDLLPKMVFRLFPTRLCMALARPFALIHLLLRPLVALVEWFSRRLLIWRGGKVFTGHLFGNREELRLVMQESAQALSSEERVMINRVLDLQTLTVRQVLKPLDQAATITTQTPLGEALNLCREKKLTRLPVWEERDRQQRIVGLLSLNPLSLQLLLLLLCLPRLDPQPQVCRGLVVGHPRLLVRLGLLFARQLRDGLLEAQGVDTVLQHPGLVLVRRNFPGILFERELVRLEQRPAELLSEALCGCLLAEGLEIQPRCLVGMDDRETDKANGQAKPNAAEREKRSLASGRARWIIGHGCPLSMGMGRRNRRTGRTPVRRLDPAPRP